MTSIDTIKTELEKRIDWAETLKAAWEKVGRCRKKDGTDFVALAKNFTNCRVYDAQYTMAPEKEIRINGLSKYSSYVSDDIKNRELYKYSKRKDKIDPDRVIKESFLEPYFYKTVDEIFEDIEGKIKYYAEYIAKLQRELEKVDGVFGKFKAAIDNALNTLSAETESSDLYYSCTEYLKNCHYGRKAV